MQWNYSSAWYPTEGDGLLFGAVTLYKLVQRQVRADATNAFNHPSFGPPNTTLTPESTPGPNGITTFAGTGTSISQVTVGGRTMQLNARLTF